MLKRFLGGRSHIAQSDAATNAHVMGSFVGTSGNDRLRGSAEDDSFDISQGGRDRVLAGAGDDTISVGAALSGNDRIDGGDGGDTLSIAGAYHRGLVFGATTLHGIEEIDLGSGYDYAIKTNDSNVAADTVLSVNGFRVGADHSLRFDGSAEQDGDFIVYSADGDDVLVGGQGNDRFVFEGGSDVIDGGGGVNVIDVALFNVATGVTIDLNKEGVSQDIGIGSVTLSHVQNAVGTMDADVLIGNAQTNMLTSTDGNDRLYGEGGNDILDAFYFPFFVGPPTDLLADGGGGRDLLIIDNPSTGASITFSLADHGPQSTRAGTITATGIEDLEASLYDDHLTGDGQANQLLGDGGNDTLIGGAGADHLFGDALYSTRDAAGNAAPPTLVDAIDGGDDRLEGGAGNDFLYGGAADDVLIGGLGTDFLQGGAGLDRFEFDSLQDSIVDAPDTIKAFNQGNLIDLSAIDADTSRPSDQAFHLGQTSGHTGDIVLSYDAARGVTVVSLFVDADGSPDAAILMSGNHTNLVQTDFIL